MDVSATAASSDLFDDGEWKVELEGVEVQELDGSWRSVTLFRNVGDEAHVCLWFGNDEYEGIDRDRPYRYCPRTEIMEDDEGDDINWRMKGLDNDDDADVDDDDDDDDADNDDDYPDS